METGLIWYLKLTTVGTNEKSSKLCWCVRSAGAGSESHVVVDEIVTSGCERVDGVANQFIGLLLSNELRDLLLCFLEVRELL